MQLMDYRQIHNYFIETVNANLDHIQENGGKLFCDFVRECYGIQAAVGIRRHIKSYGDSISMMKLLEQIKQCAQQFTYDFYLQQYPIDGFEWQESTFSNFSDDNRVISERGIEDDIQKLNQIGAKVTAFVDRGVAHLDKRGTEGDVTYNDLDECLILFDSISCKYNALLTSDGYSTLESAIQFNWQKIFTVPLDNSKSVS